MVKAKIFLFGILLVVILGGNVLAAPVAEIGVFRDTGIAPYTVLFTGIDSSNIGDIYRYEWDFKDSNVDYAQTDTGRLAGHRFDTPGIYDVELTVYDNTGASDTTTIPITVLDKPGNAVTIYVSSSTGNDADDGLTIDTPLKTIDGVNQIISTVPDGSSILFRSGDTFNRDCPSCAVNNRWYLHNNANDPTFVGNYFRTPPNFITIGSYGTENKPVLDVSIVAGGASSGLGIIFDGVEVTGAISFMPLSPSPYPGIQTILRDVKTSHFATWGSSGVTLENVVSDCNGNTGSAIAIQQQNMELDGFHYYKNVEVMNCVGHGFYLAGGGHDVLVEGARIHDNDLPNPLDERKVGFNSHGWGENIIIRDSEIYNNGVGLGLDSAYGNNEGIPTPPEYYHNSIVENNRFYGNGYAMQFSSQRNLIVRNNLIYDNGWQTYIVKINSPSNQGTTVDEGSENIQLYNNVFVNNINSPIVIEQAQVGSVFIKNNIFSNGLTVLRAINAYGTVFSNNFIDGNVNLAGVSRSAADWVAIDPTSSMDDPQLLLDLSVAETSPAIDAGDYVNALFDFDSNLRDANPDIGAYEFMGPCELIGDGTEICTGGLDEDCDGFVDCADSDCDDDGACDCQLDSAIWSHTSVVAETEVTLTVRGTNCDGEEVSFEVWEDDLGGDDFADVQPVNAPFSDGSVTTTWIAEWQCDGELAEICTLGNPEYYFIANVVSNLGELIESTYLEVIEDEGGEGDLAITKLYTYPETIEVGDNVYVYCNVSDSVIDAQDLDVTLEYKRAGDSGWTAMRGGYLERPIISTHGDSITAGSDYWNPDPSHLNRNKPETSIEHSYQYWLDLNLNSDTSVLDGLGYQIYNNGYQGFTCQQISPLFLGDSAGLGNGDYAIIMCGTNYLDLWETKSSPFIPEMVSSARSRGITPILMTIPPYDWNSANRNCVNMEDYNTWLRDYATTNDVLLIDIHTLFDNGEECIVETHSGLNELMYDVGDFPWVHPNVVGHEVIGNAIWEQVFNKALFESYGASVNVDVSENYEFRCIVNNGDSEVSGVVVALGSAGECTLDSQCDDSIACTTDICNLPGTPESSCSTAPITLCADDDGCCPDGCSSANDNNCVASECTLISAILTETELASGDIAELTIVGENCADGEVISFEIWEDDSILGVGNDDFTSFEMLEGAFVGNVYVATWEVVYNKSYSELFEGNLEYYFKIFVEAEEIESNRMAVPYPGSVPEIVAVNPEVIVYFNRFVPLEFEALDGDVCWYVLDGGESVESSCKTDTSLNLRPATKDVVENHDLLIGAENNAGVSTWSVSFDVTRSREKIIKYEKFHGRGETSDLTILTDLELESVESLIFGDGVYGAIEFTEIVNLVEGLDVDEDTVDIDSNVNISYGRVEVDSSMTSLNKHAKIKLRDLTFSDPQILKDGSVCGDCSIESYSGGELIFSVSGFSVYEVEETPTGPGPGNDGSDSSSGTPSEPPVESYGGKDLTVVGFIEKNGEVEIYCEGCTVSAIFDEETVEDTTVDGGRFTLEFGNVDLTSGANVLSLTVTDSEGDTKTYSKEIFVEGDL